MTQKSYDRSTTAVIELQRRRNAPQKGR